MKTKKKAKDEICDEILELLLIAYTYGCEDANEMLGTEIAPTYDEMRESVYRKIAGKDWEQRVGQYILDFDESRQYGEEPKPTAETGEAVTPINIDTAIFDIMRVADTDMGRVYNEAEMNTADVAVPEIEKSGRTVTKKWRTMEDDRVRDTHDYINGVEIPYNAEFHTYDGDHALRPFGFMFDHNNIHCRCHLDFFIK